MGLSDILLIVVGVTSVVVTIGAVFQARRILRKRERVLETRATAARYGMLLRNWMDQELLVMDEDNLVVLDHLRESDPGMYIHFVRPIEQVVSGIEPNSGDYVRAALHVEWTDEAQSEGLRSRQAESHLRLDLSLT